MRPAASALNFLTAVFLWLLAVTSGDLYACGLDLANGVYYRRYTQSGVTAIEARYYAHRALPNLLVTEVAVECDAAAPCELRLAHNAGAPSADIAFKAVNTSSTAVTWHGFIDETEEPSSARVEVAYTASVVPATLTVPGGTNATHYFVAATVSSVNTTGSSLPVIASGLQAVAVAAGPDLMASHAAAWAALWEGGMEVGGDLGLAQAINSSLYYILSSVRSDYHWSLSPGGLASDGYNGHSFWDCETWMAPSLFAFYPALGRSVLAYRAAHLAGAALKAQSYSPPYDGTMFPWESAFTGEEVCPLTAPTGQYEQHITGDIVFAVRQYYDLGGFQDAAWVKAVAWPIVNGSAVFWASRVALVDGQYVIDGVIPPDEYAVGVNNSGPCFHIVVAFGCVLHGFSVVVRYSVALIFCSCLDLATHEPQRRRHHHPSYSLSMRAGSQCTPTWWPSIHSSLR